MNFIRNKLLWTVGLLFAGYWSAGWLIPNVTLSLTLGIFAIFVGVAIMVRYFSTMVDVLFRERRSEYGDGAHLAAIGIPAVAASIVYGGAFTLAWNLTGQPADWIGTPASNFSRLLLVCGCVALYLTPDMERQRLHLPNVYWLTTFFALAAVAGFVAGAYMGDGASARVFPQYRVSYPVCPPDRPVWAAAQSQFYHAPDSPYRHLVRPRRCYATEADAMEDGLSPVL